MTSGWTSPKENLGLILSQGRFLWRIDITVFEMARNLQWSDQVDAEYEKTQIRQTSEQIHSVENHVEKVSQDTEMKEMETAEVQESCENNKLVAKEIKVLRLTWEELLLAEKHMESVFVEGLSSDHIKSTRPSLAQEDPAGKYDSTKGKGNYCIN